MIMNSKEQELETMLYELLDEYFYITCEGDLSWSYIEDVTVATYNPTLQSKLKAFHKAVRAKKLENSL